MDKSLRSVGLVATSALALFAVGCGPEEDDTDSNKTFTVDGYVETTEPQPPTDIQSCNYQLAAVQGNPGVSPNQIVPVTHHWEGFRPADAMQSGVDISEFYDCDGSKGIDAIMIDMSKFL